MGVELSGARLHQFRAVLHERDILGQRDQLRAGGAGLAHQRGSGVEIGLLVLAARGLNAGDPNGFGHGIPQVSMQIGIMDGPPGARKSRDIDPRGTRLAQRAGAGRDGGPGRQHVIHQQDATPGHKMRARLAHREGTLHVAPPSRPGEPGLRRCPPGPHQQVRDHHGIRLARHEPGEDRRLVEAPCQKPPAVERHRHHQIGIRQERRRCALQPRSEPRREPRTVGHLEGEDQLAPRALVEERRPRPVVGRRQPGAIAAERIRSRLDGEGQAAAGAAGPADEGDAVPAIWAEPTGRATGASHARQDGGSTRSTAPAAAARAHAAACAPLTPPGIVCTACLCFPPPRHHAITGVMAQRAPPPDGAAVFDRKAVRIHRDRAAPGFAGRGDFLVREVGERLVGRLDDVKRRFARVLDLAAIPGNSDRCCAGRRRPIFSSRPISLRAWLRALPAQCGLSPTRNGCRSALIHSISW